MSNLDTIAAIATAPGRGGIAIIRVSGSLAKEALKQISNIENPKSRYVYFKKFRDQNEIIDEGVVIFFEGPNSYTGEDTVEFQGHGGNIVPQRVLDAVLKIKGIRQAEKGEFTKRAFLNGKMDLTKAEAVEDLISASSNSAAKAAFASLDGVFASKLNELTEELTHFRVRIEACLDFPEEHEDFFDSGRAKENLQNLLNKTTKTIEIASYGIKLNEGANIVLAGSPNAGKSSLLNALAGSEKAIVTNIPGTTRDLLSVNIELCGIPVTLTDTAGIRDTPSDEIEAIGIKRAKEVLKKADLVLLVVDSSKKAYEAQITLSNIQKEIDNKTPILVVKSKSDLIEDEETKVMLSSGEFASLQKITSSTKREDGLKQLHNELVHALGVMPIEGVFSARRRHVNALIEVKEAVERAISILDFGDLVLCAREIAIAQDNLGLITGKVTSDDILGIIFSTFCIGK